MDNDLEAGLRDIASHVRAISRIAPLDVDHRARLRNELLQRHQALSMARSERGMRGRWFRPQMVKRLSLIGFPAAAVAVAASMVLWLLPISGGQTSPAAEAQRITSALARTAPTVTAWDWTLRRSSGGVQRVDRLGVQLTPFQRLYVDHGQAYLYSYGQWKLMAPVGPSTDGDSTEIYWQRALASLLASLQAKNFVLLGSATVDGKDARGIRSRLVRAHGQRITVTAWVDEKSGLVLRLARVVARGTHVIERDVADYSYKRTG